MTPCKYLLALVLLTQCADALSSDEALLDEIVIVAGRRAVDTKDVAAAVSSVGRDAVTQQKIVTDALQSLVGVVVQQTTPGQGAAIIRGLKGSAILHLVDGMRLSNAMFRTAPTPWFALVPASSVERIEVLRGTPASLYGSEAVGGVVDSVSRLPVFNTDDLSWARNVVATFDSAELQRSIRATVDGGTHRLAASVSAEYLETGNRRTGSGERIAPSGYSAKAVRAVLSATPDSNDSWYIDLHYLEQPETPRIDELIPGFGQTEPSSDEFVFAPNRRIFAHAHRRHLSATDIEWQLDAAWQRIDDDRTTRDFGSEERLFEENRSDLYGITLNAARDSGAFNWIAGADLYYDEVSSTRSAQDINSESSRTLTPRFPDGSTISHAGLFVNSSVDINEWHTVLFGLRYTDVSIDLPDGTKIDPGRMSGDLGWIFQVSEEVAFVANLGAGFRAPNIADLGTLGNRPGNRFNIPNTALGAESATHGDLGLRFRGDRWRAEVVAFAMRYTDRIVSISTGTATPDGRDIVQSVNAASSDLYGVEAGARLNLGERADVRLALNYTRGDQEVAGISEPADRVPPLNGRLEIGYALADHWYLKATLVGAARQDRLSSRDVSDARIDPDGTPGWTIAGVRASWASESGWETTLGVDNLLDKRYRVHGSGLDAPGRNLFLTVRRDW